MSTPLHSIYDGAETFGPGESPDAAFDAMFDALAGRRRQEVLSVLADRRSPVPETDLVSQVVAREEAKPLREVRDEEHQRVHASLHHAHLPKLADAGLIARDTDRENARSVSATGHPLFRAPEFDALLRREETDPDATDAALSALADGQRRSMLSVLADTGRLTEVELARRVARRADDALDDSDDGIDNLLASFCHVHLPILARAGLVIYDAEARTVAYEGHPAIEDHWFDRPFDEVPR